MPDTTTPNLGLTKPERFASTNTWGDKLNTNLDLLDEAIQDAQDVANAAAPQSRTLGSAGGTISGLGTLEADKPNIEVVPNKTTQRVEVYVGGVSIGTAKRINFASGSFFEFQGAQADADTINITGTGADSEVAITEALATIGLPSSVARSNFIADFLRPTPAVLATVPSGRKCTRPHTIVTNNSSVEEGCAAWFVSSGGSAADANKVASVAYKIPPGKSFDIGASFMHILDQGGTIVAASEFSSTSLSMRVSMVTCPTSNGSFIEVPPILLTTSMQTIRTIVNPTARIAWFAHNLSSNYVGLTVAFRRAAAGSDSGAHNVGAYSSDLLAPGDFRVYEAPDVLEAGDLIRASASHNSSISFRASVVEM